MNSIKYFLKNSSLHGLHYIVESKRHWSERIFWCFISIGAIIGSVKLFQLTWYSFLNNAVSFTVETTYLEWETTFPAVSVCEHDSPDKIYDLGNKLFGEDRNMNLDFYLRDIVFFDGTCYSCKTHCNKTITCTENITYLVEQVRAPCESLIANCKWNGVPFNCCNHFLKLETEIGTCFSLNSFHTNSFHKLLKSNYLTGPGGLTFKAHEAIKTNISILHSNLCRVLSSGSSPDDLMEWLVYVNMPCPDQYYNQRPQERGYGVNHTIIAADSLVMMQQWLDTFMQLRVLIHAPEDVPYMNHPQEEKEVLTWGHLFNITFKVKEIENDPRIRNITLSFRNCRFPEENILSSYSLYSYSACIVDCRMRAQLQFCGCIHHFTPTTFKAKLCDIQGLICLTNHSETLRILRTPDSEKEGITCNCMASCSEPEYDVISKAKEQNENYKDPDYGSEILVQMDSLPNERFKRNIVKTPLDLIVSMGGAAGLFLGASILSICECVYFLFVKRHKERQIKMPHRRDKNTLPRRKDILQYKCTLVREYQSKINMQDIKPNKTQIAFLQ